MQKGLVIGTSWTAQTARPQLLLQLHTHLNTKTAKQSRTSMESTTSSPWGLNYIQQPPHVSSAAVLFSCVLQSEGHTCCDTLCEAPGALHPAHINTLSSSSSNHQCGRARGSAADCSAQPVPEEREQSGTGGPLMPAQLS